MSVLEKLYALRARILDNRTKDQLRSELLDAKVELLELRLVNEQAEALIRNQQDEIARLMDSIADAEQVSHVLRVAMVKLVDPNVEAAAMARLRSVSTEVIVECQSALAYDGEDDYCLAYTPDDAGPIVLNEEDWDRLQADLTECECTPDLSRCSMPGCLGYEVSEESES